jgi:hypothetical protein
MIKKIFFTLLIMLVSSNISFAKSNDEVDSKNNNKINAKNINEVKSEPHFDLPKKDAKEQCEEVERVVNLIETKNVVREINDFKIVDINICHESFDGQGYFSGCEVSDIAYMVLKKNRPVGITKIIFNSHNKENLVYKEGYLVDIRSYNKYSKSFNKDLDQNILDSKNLSWVLFTKIKPKNTAPNIHFSGCLILDFNNF